MTSCNVKVARLRVLFKRGDVQNHKNYRPISMLPILLKLFTRVVHARISDTLARGQCRDQAGFKKGYGCEDHLFTVTMLYETCAEWNMPLWIAAIDFKKAFDTVEQGDIWTALEEQGIPPQYVNVFKRLYADQTGTVIAKRTSRTFSITRGTKQGDPVSLALFNAVLEKAITKVKSIWMAKGFGIRIGPFQEDILSNLQFADDVFLLAKSIKTLRKIIKDLEAAVGEVGLEMHMGKTISVYRMPEVLGKRRHPTSKSE